MDVRVSTRSSVYVCVCARARTRHTTPVLPSEEEVAASKVSNPRLSEAGPIPVVLQRAADKAGLAAAPVRPRHTDPSFLQSFS